MIRLCINRKKVYDEEVNIIIPYIRLDITVL